jgi:capsid protein
MYFKDVVRQRQKEEKLIKAAGLTFSSEATKPGANDRQQTMSNNDTQDQKENADASN